MAELLAGDPRLRATTAIKRLMGTKNDSDIRRLQVKWKAEGGILLSQAQERRVRRQSGAPATPWHDPRAIQRISEMLGPWATLRLPQLESPSLKAAIEAQARLMESFKPSLAMIEAMKPSLAMQAAIESMKPSLAMQAAIESMKPSLAMQAAIEATKPSLAMQAAIEAMKPSLAMRAAIEAMKPSLAMQAAIEAMKLPTAMQTAMGAMKPMPAMRRPKGQSEDT